MCSDDHHEASHGCPEYARLSRRRFLSLSGGTLAAAAASGWLPKVALAQSENSSRDVLVSIFLRGGADGLSLCVPHGEDAYYDLRPSLAWPRPDSSEPSRVADLDGFFGLAPAMQPLLDAYSAGDLLFVQATGSHDPTRSHFEAMYFMEVGVPQPPPTLATGWLGRHLLSTSPRTPGSILRAVGLDAGLQRQLVGAPQALPIPDLANYDLLGDPSSTGKRRNAIKRMFKKTREPLRSSSRDSVDTIELLKQIGFDSYQPAGGASYTQEGFGYALRSTAALIKAEVGVEAIAIDLGGWDTHSQQGQQDGFIEFLMGELATNLAAFHADLEADNFDDVTTVAMSEFGRNAFENGSQGTDHGHGNVMMLLGEQIDGGRVLTEWPGLEPGELYAAQDLDVTIDYRDVLSEVVRRRLDNPRLGDVFPDSDYEPTEWGVTL